METLEPITPEEARARLMVSYRKSSEGNFLEALRRPLLNPIEQRDDQGKRKVHPLLIVGTVLLILAGSAVAFFTIRL
jgi:hypothetical protein